MWIPCLICGLCRGLELFFQKLLQSRKQCVKEWLDSIQAAVKGNVKYTTVISVVPRWKSDEEGIKSGPLCMVCLLFCHGFVVCC